MELRQLATDRCDAGVVAQGGERTDDGHGCNVA
jgi:hypothetical protein